ncbi:MAG: hypothetical protein K5873_05365 [Treponema sp.]|nr:hypothetical protein [Treponema sp.]
MIVVFIAAFFCVLNISLWVTFFLKFKKIFSTDDIVASTREELDNMILDINRNAGRNIEIIEDRIKQLKAVVAEADRHVEVARRELENQKNVLSYQKKIDSVIQDRKENKSGLRGRAADQYLRNQNISDGLRSSASYELTEEGNRQTSRPIQGDLFEDAEMQNDKGIVSASGTTFTVESDGSSFASVPVIGTNVTYAEDSFHHQKNFAQMVRDLNAAGHSKEEIARELNSSLTEVQLVLDMDLGF